MVTSSVARPVLFAGRRCRRLSQACSARDRLLAGLVRAASARGQKREMAKIAAGEEDQDLSSARERVLKQVLQEINVQFGKGSIMTIGDGSEASFGQVETFPSGSLALDLAIGGGYPKGRIVEIFGPESCGKTTLALHAMAEVQKVGGTVALIDAEHAFDPKYSEKIGIDMEKMVLCQPDSGEMALEVVDQLLRSSAVDLICIDSVSALVPRAELEGEVGAPQMGLQARLMSQALRKITSSASRSNCCVIFINQLRQNIGVMYGNPEVTSGGNALKYYSSLRLEVRRKEILKGENGDRVGIGVRVKSVKNKCFPPYRESNMEIIFGKGVSRLASLLDAAEIAGFVSKRGPYYFYGEQRLGQGKEKTMAALQEDQALMDKIEADVRATLFEIASQPTVLPTELDA